MIMILRYGKKLTSGKPHCVNPNGDHDHDSLIVVGWVRAGGLVELFAPICGEPAPGLRRLDLIYASASDGGRSRPSIQIVSPLASRVAVDIDCRFAHGEEQKLAEHLRTGIGTAWSPGTTRRFTRSSTISGRYCPHFLASDGRLRS